VPTAQNLADPKPKPAAKHPPGTPSLTDSTPKGSSSRAIEADLLEDQMIQQKAKLDDDETGYDAITPLSLA
jgi:hypothetical protein